MLYLLIINMWFNITCKGLSTSNMTKDYSIEHLIDTIDEIKNSKETFSCNAIRTLENHLFGHSSSNVNNILEFQFIIALSKVLMQNYHGHLKITKINLFFVQIFSDMLVDRKELLIFILKLYANLKINTKTTPLANIENSQNIKYQFLTKVKINDFISIVKKSGNFNFMFIDNSSTSFDQIYILKQIILLINQKKKINLNYANVFFSFELSHNKQNGKQLAHNFTSTIKKHAFILNPISSQLSIFDFKEYKENNVANQNEKKIGEHYEFDKNDKKFRKVSDYTCSISKRNKFIIITFCDITITNGIRRTDSLYNLNSIKNDEEIKKYEISFNEFSMSFKLVFFVQTTKYNDYHIDKGSRNFMIISVSIYYNYKHNYKLFGRFSYIIDKSNVNQLEIKNRHHAIVKVINDQIKFKIFKKQLIDYLSADFINLADFFKTQNLFLNYIDHMYWAQTKSYFMSNKCVYKFLNKNRLENLVCKIKEISKDNTEITFFQAEVIDSQALIPRKYDDKIFNLVRIIKAIDFEQICDDYLTSIDALIISFTTRTTQNTRYYLVLPYNAYEYLMQLAHVSAEADNYFEHYFSNIANFFEFATCVTLKRLIINFFSSSKSKFILSQMNPNDIDAIVCEQRIKLYTILTNVQIKYYPIVQTKYSKAQLSKWLQGIVHEHLIYDDPIYKHLQSIFAINVDMSALFIKTVHVLKQFMKKYQDKLFKSNICRFIWFFDYCSMIKTSKEENTVLNDLNSFFKLIMPEII